MYHVRISRRALRQLEKLPLPVRKRIDSHIQELKNDPRPLGCRKLAGASQAYRIRVGPWRVIYEVDDQLNEVLIAWIGPRGSAY
ncbi:type II toxin-antitoxin system RelE/ParE family toxin [bacterium]|nr:type II toxin-antitoxin system RelE/ParE family toxin [bacterium]